MILQDVKTQKISTEIYSYETPKTYVFYSKPTRISNECIKLLSLHWSSKQTVAMSLVLHSKKMFLNSVIQSFRMKVVGVL